MSRTSLTVDEDIKDALTKTPLARGVKLTKDPKRPRWVIQDSIRVGESLKEDFEQVAALLKEHEPCAILIRLKDAEGTLAADDDDWVVITWSPENMPEAVLQRHAAGAASLQEKLGHLKLAELQAGNWAGVTWACFLEKAKEIVSGEVVRSPSSRKRMSSFSAPKITTEEGSPGMGAPTPSWLSGERMSFQANMALSPTSAARAFAPAQRSQREVQQEAKAATAALERDAGSTIDMFQPWVIITNFQGYIDAFSAQLDAPITMGSTLQCAHSDAEDVTIVHYTGGSSGAGSVVDLLGRVAKFELVLFAGLVGPQPSGVDLYGTFLKPGEVFVPLGAVRGEGVSENYLPAGAPAAPDLTLLKAILEETEGAHKGVVYSMSRRFWEFDEPLKKKMAESSADALDMETATVLAAARKIGIKAAALHLVSDSPIEAPRDAVVSKRFAQQLAPEHIATAVRALRGAAEVLHTTDRPEIKRYMSARAAKSGGS